MMRAFISYSHFDEWAVERLHAHLAMLRDQNLVDDWYDRKLLAGDHLDDTISDTLETSGLFIAMLSPDFLNSRYCFSIEMGRAMELHEAGQLRLLPVIVEPCDWKNSPLKSYLATPKDGQPISTFTNNNAAFLNVATDIRKIIDAQNQNDVENKHVFERVIEHEIAKKYRIKKIYDQIDKAEFRKLSFSHFGDYFSKSAKELNEVDGVRARYEKTSETSFTATIVNKHKHGETASITVHLGSGGGLGDIYYSFKEYAPKNTANGTYSVEVDEYDIFLSKGMSIFNSRDDKRLSPQRAAELLWNEFMEQAGVGYA